MRQGTLGGLDCRLQVPSLDGLSLCKGTEDVLDASDATVEIGCQRGECVLLPDSIGGDGIHQEGCVPLVHNRPIYACDASETSVPEATAVRSEEQEQDDEGERIATPESSPVVVGVSSSSVTSGEKSRHEVVHTSVHFSFSFLMFVRFTAIVDDDGERVP